MSFRCRVGKSCGATCIQRDKKCLLELPEKLAQSVANVAARLYQRNDAHNLLDTPAKGVRWIETNTNRLLVGGFDNPSVGGLGQYGKASAPVWFIGLEGAGISKDLLFGDPKATENKVIERYERLGFNSSPGRGVKRGENKMLDDNRLMYVNALRDHMNMNTAVQKKAAQLGIETKDLLWPVVASTAAKPGVTAKELLEKIKKAPEGLSANEVRSWGRSSSSYSMKGMKLAEKLNEREIALFNISDLVRPGLSTFPVRDFLAENKVNLKTFAGGVYRNDQSWYKASAAAKSEKIVSSVMENRPKLVYIAGQNKNGPQGELFSQILAKAGVTPRVAEIDSKNFNNQPVHTRVDYGVIEHPGGGKTVVAWGMHLTGTSGSWTETERVLAELAK